MKIVSVEYEKPGYSVRDRYAWRFVAHTDENLPHGYPTFSGYLVKAQAGWMAKAHSGDFGMLANSREQAITNIIPATIRAGKEVIARAAAQDAAKQSCLTLARKLSEGLPKNVSVRIVNAEAIHEAPRFTVEVANLNDEQVRTVLRALARRNEETV